MQALEFDATFQALTGNSPFPWLRKLYERFVEDRADNIPSCVNVPTGLGKTSVVTVWLIALVNHPEKMPRRLVYVVNRRTVVDQTTDEVVKWLQPLTDNRPPWHPAFLDLSQRLRSMCAMPLEKDDSPLALSTLRGQFADNREWSADPCRPAVICGTVDMIGSRLLFSGYGVGFKGKPLHAGFLGQDVLVVHDEAHLEPAFQELLLAIEKEQHDGERTGSLPWPKMRVMELTATSRSQGQSFELTKEEKDAPALLPDPPTEPLHVAWRRQKARKAITLHELADEKKLADEIAGLALKFKESGRAVLVFVRKVDDVDKIVKKLPKGSWQQLTGTLRGLERDLLAKNDPIFARFLPPSNRAAGVGVQAGTVYLVCTSAGEVGVNISADHLVCDLTTFDSMAQRFGRVNRFGERTETEIHVLHPKEFDEKEDYQSRLKKTLYLLQQLNGDGSPAALGQLDPNARQAAFAPTPTILPVSDILFDTWALTTIRGKLPGRPPVEPYLHGLANELPETHVAWREEVGVIKDDLLGMYQPKDLLEDYPLKPHELLRDNSSRVFDRLKNLNCPPERPVWIVTDDDSVTVTTLGKLIEAGKDGLAYKTVLLPPSAGGLKNGMLTGDSDDLADDVADEWRDDKGNQRRVRLWDNDPPEGMRRIRPPIDTKPDAEEMEDEETLSRRLWTWCELPNAGDSDGSKTNNKPVRWDVHTKDVVDNVTALVKALPLPEEMKRALILAAHFHDLGKRRDIWQRSIGNPNPSKLLLGKSGRRMKPLDLSDYRHEFGSMLDLLDPRQTELRIVDPEQTHSAEYEKLNGDLKDVVLHLIAVHHGMGRPHFPPDNVFDPNAEDADASQLAAEVPRRYARLQRKYGRWGLPYLESLLRAADWAASAKPSAFEEEQS